jgi:hypothetical protein
MSDNPPELSTAWFTFGQAHVHRIGSRTVDHDCVLEITSGDPRKTMEELFGNKWSMQYDEPPDMRLFPRGIIKL